MKLALAAPHQILVELSAQEQQRYGLLKDAVSGEELRRTLRQILTAVAAVSGRRFRLQRRVRAELLPDRAGGCLLIISGLEEQTDPARCFCFAAETENDLIDAAQACGEAGREIKVTLLKGETCYYLLIPSLPDRLKRRLSEFMRCVLLDASAEALLWEGCKALAVDQPLSVLGGSA